MVGTPRSKGCSTCRKRKIKCDKRQPHCHNCQVSGWKCDGYERKWKFIQEETQLCERYKKKRYLFEDYRDHMGSYLINYRHKRQGSYELEEVYGGLGWPFRVSISRLPTSRAEQQATRFVYILDDAESQAIFPLRSLG